MYSGSLREDQTGLTFWGRYQITTSAGASDAECHSGPAHNTTSAETQPALLCYTTYPILHPASGDQTSQLHQPVSPRGHSRLESGRGCLRWMWARVPDRSRGATEAGHDRRYISATISTVRGCQPKSCSRWFVLICDELSNIFPLCTEKKV